MMGLATDGGLLLPEALPEADNSTITSWKDLSYQDLAFEVLSLFVTDIPSHDLKTLIDRSYSTFTHPGITPVIRHGDIHILELFYGPTLAFKDVALQFLGNVFEYLLEESHERMNILGATSGDTGSAAIYGVRGKERINIFILHPHKRVSRVQELQMTSVIDPNVFNIAIKGTFDDGQAIVKGIFNDIPYKNEHQLGAVNSINWARIVAQVVYYIYAYFRVCEKTGAQMVDFSVPTGNFGDIFAGYVAKRLLGERIGTLVLATNENDLLTRFVSKGDYSLGKVVQTSSPSMDIQVASNFERYLYYLHGEDARKTRQNMESFSETGKMSFTSDQIDQIRSVFTTRSVNETETLETIRNFHEKYGYVLDPHTAVGVCAAFSHLDSSSGSGQKNPIISLSTAHPAKFGTAVKKAIGREPDRPESLKGLEDRETRCEILDAEVGAVKEFIDKNAL